MSWETPQLVEIRMDAEIGSYQEDFSGDEDAPIVSEKSTETVGQTASA